ncbi:MAG: hypothetical protein PW734_01680 [Verrucomicrobium sp.]|nr:hypothetical protein [Verrucomicrobium sp.]
MKTTLLAALSLDGGWVTPRLAAPELAAFLRLAGKGPVWTDLSPRPGLRAASRRELARRAQQEPLRLLPSPALAAALLEREGPLRLLLWWRPELPAGQRRTLVPPGAPRALFTLRRTRKLGGGIVGVYER